VPEPLKHRGDGSGGGLQQMDAILKKERQQGTEGQEMKGVFHCGERCLNVIRYVI